MRDGEKEYEIAKDAASSIGCHVPEEHIFHSTVANTPAFIREYFFLKGWIDCKKNSSFLNKEKSKC